MAPSRVLLLLSHASRLWRIWTMVALLSTSLGLAAEAPVAGKPAAAPLFSDQEWERGSAGRTATTPDTTTPAITGILASLALVIGLAVGLGMLVKRFGMRRIMPKKGRHLEVVEQVTIGYKRTVSLVRIADQVLVIGLGEHELSHLATLPAGFLDQARVSAPAPATPETGKAGGFRKALDQALGRTP